MRRIATIVSLVLATLAIAIALAWQLDPTGPFDPYRSVDPFRSAYKANCAGCHGDRLEGTARGTPLVNVDLKHGDSVEDIRLSITRGFPSTGMPAWSGVPDDV